MSIVLLILLLCSSAMQAGGCVSPIPGENLWRLTARIGSCLDTLSCAFGNIIPLTQANLSGGMTITAPGHYKLCEDVTAPSTAVVEINSNGVIFDLGGFTLTNMDIYIGDGVAVKDVVVQNGVMTDAPRFIDIFPSGSQNIVLQNLTLDTVNNSATPNFAIRALTVAGKPLTGLMLNNITIYNGAPNNIVVAGISGSLISDVVIDNVQMIGTNSALAVSPGVSNSVYVFECNNVFINNVSIENPAAGVNGVWIDTSSDVFVTNTSVVSSNTLSGTPAGFTVIRSSMVTLDPCICDGAAFNNGILFDGTNTNNCACNNCNVTNVSNVGIMASAAVINNCSVSRANVSGYNVTTCVVNNSSATNNLGVGFVLNASNTLSNTLAAFNGNGGYSLVGNSNIINNAIANTNTGSGFAFSSPDGQAVLTDCQALNNTSGGFILGDGGFDICQGCTAYDNLNYGFSVGSANNIFESCTSANNGGDGFRVTGNGNSFMFCVSNHNGTEGFYISILDGCMITSSVANENEDCGFLIENIMAEADFDPIIQNPEDLTWNIGAFAKTLSTTTDRNVRLANNTAFQNANQNIIMKGFVSDALGFSPSQTFTDTIYTTIGIINTLYGSVIIDQKPVPNTIVSSATAVSGQIANVVGGNITDDPTHDPN